jgi:hypothetical protein
MRLKNHTDLSDEWIRAVIRAVRPSGISNFDVRISNCADGSVRGRAYTQGSSYHDRAAPFIVVSVAKTDQAARFIKKGEGGYLPMVIGNRKEAVLMVLAHELRHLWQAKHSRGRVYGARGKFSERDADAYALQMLRRYRRGELAASH